MDKEATWLDIVVQEAFIVHAIQCLHHTLSMSPQFLLCQVLVAEHQDELTEVTMRHASLHQVDVFIDLEVLNVAHDVVLAAQLVCNGYLR